MIKIERSFGIISVALIFPVQMQRMLLPANFNIVDLEPSRRRHVLLASLAVTASLTEMQRNLATHFEQCVASLAYSADTSAAKNEGLCRAAPLNDHGAIETYDFRVGSRLLPTAEV
ncbi:hypothetical protein [Sphingomonas sp. PP-F2F-G114-C0414]|uniref:hypothetical protein n=1 Tax=Sphingomonas sp. PP-F2F-G114-C0414 TaxID=2135662 RepID=UPI0011C345E1|nr:hypothetical protein [Sphingomonas sp. PP-F2F-G114-C0414]